jgi:hypothetical protein
MGSQILGSQILVSVFVGRWELVLVTWSVGFRDFYLVLLVKDFASSRKFYKDPGIWCLNRN